MRDKTLASGRPDVCGSCTSSVLPIALQEAFLKTLLAWLFSLALVLSPSMAQQPPGSGSRAFDKKLNALPAGEHFWRIDNLPTLDQAQSAAGPSALVVEASGKVWLFTLGPKGGATPDATKVAEVGPLPPVQAEEYLLRILHAVGPPGWRSQTHSHPGSEALYVLKGRIGHKSSHGTEHVEAGSAMNVHGADVAMELFSTGPADFELFAMFVLDAKRPFSSPARLE